MDSYYDDKKWCPTCQDYVHYLMSVERSYCVDCGERVRLFSKEDWEHFNENLSKNKNKGRGRRRRTDAESA